MSSIDRTIEHPTKQPANPRTRRWRADEIARMVSAGILRDDEPFELIAGELVARMQKGARHELIRNELVLNWARRLPEAIKFADEAPLRLGLHDEPEPDITLFPSSLKVNEVRGDSVLLVVEIADSSLSYDLKIKAPYYASFSVRETWVIDAKTLLTTVLLNPGPEGYADSREVPASDLLTPTACPELAIRLADLDLG